MSYDFNQERKALHTPEGQKALLTAAFAARELCRRAGVVAGATVASESGLSDSFHQLAVVDTLVELGFLIEIPTQPGWPRVLKWSGP